VARAALQAPGAVPVVLVTNPTELPGLLALQAQEAFLDFPAPAPDEAAQL
jgi:hypothetical protein